MSDGDPRHDGETGGGTGEGGRHDEAASPASEEQRRREVTERLKQLRVADLVEEMLIGLVTVGYQKLGLTEQTRELRDLDDARLAIETLRAWLDVLARERGEAGLADLRSTVAAMQLSYARVAAEPSTAAEPGPVAQSAAAEPGPTAEPDAAAGQEAEGAGTDDPEAGGAAVPEPSAE